jgi:hypothetical protein
MDHPKTVSDIAIKKDDIEYQIAGIEESMLFKFNHKSDYLTNPILTPSQTDIVIKEDFLIAVINYDILNEFNIPSLFVYSVQKNDWLALK